MQPLEGVEPSISSVLVLGDGRIAAQFQTGHWVLVDFRSIPGEGDIVSEGGIFTGLGNDDYLKQVQIGDYGYWLEWPGDLDFGADQIWGWGQAMSVAQQPQKRAS